MKGGADAKMVRKKCSHVYGRWFELEDEKGKKYRKQCLLCNRVYTIRKPTVQAVQGVKQE